MPQPTPCFPPFPGTKVCFSGWHVLAKVALNDGVNAVALAMAREVCATILMFIIARRCKPASLDVNCGVGCTLAFSKKVLSTLYLHIWDRSA